MMGRRQVLSLILLNLFLIPWCKAQSCGLNEEIRCVKQCPPETTCRTRGIAYRCKYDWRPCVNKCVCKEGYFRNAEGHCITNEQCDRCNGDHEYFDCDGACDNVCSDLYKQSKDNCLIKTFVCVERCYCDDGYARNAYNSCIPIQDCPFY